MKNFDIDREARRRAALEADRGFQIGGETFLRAVDVKPEALTALDRVKQARRDENGVVVEAGSGVAEDIGAIDDVIIGMLDPADNGHERYVALRERDKDVLTLEDMRELMEWLIEQATGRPTVPPSPSTPPRETAAT